MAGMADKLQASRKSQMEAFTTFFFAVGGALNFVRYGLWVLFPLATLVLLLARSASRGWIPGFCASPGGPAWCS